MMAAVEGDLMISRPIRTLQTSFVVLGVSVLVGLSAINAWAASAQATSLPPYGAGVAVAASTGGNATATKISAIGATLPANPGTTAPSTTHSQLEALESLSPAQRRTFERAASLFTVFCHDWERLLHEREVDNLTHLSWSKSGDLETAMYTGYGRVESCECKPSRQGLPIGKIRYEEKNYSIVGKTIEEARHAEPKVVHEISTLEIFSWDKGKWFY
jgi:hypothetical protein